jgi:hypothetical protein
MSLLLSRLCSFAVSYESKWLVTQALPVILGFAVLVVLVSTRLLQYVSVFVTVPVPVPVVVCFVPGMVLAIALPVYHSLLCFGYPV